MATSILSNSLQEEDTIQNNIVETKDSEPISHELMFQNSIPVNLPIDREEVEVKEEVVDNRWMFENSEKVEEPSAWEKLEYGWDKNTMVLGDIMDIGYNYLTALFDPEKDMKDIAVERETNRLEEFQKEHWKMLSGKHDGVYTFMGEAASYVLDPYYIAGYYFGSPLLKSPIGSMVLNAGLLGGDEFITQLAQKGEIESWGEVGKAAAIGGGIGLVLPIGGKLVAKYLPNHLKNRAKEIASFIDNKIAKRNNLTSEELKIIREIGQTSSVKEISNKLDKLVLSSGWKTTSNNFAAPIANAKKSFYSLKTKLSKEAFDINKARQKILEPLKNVPKDPASKVFKKIQKEYVVDPIKAAAQAEGKKILDIKQKISDSRIAWKEKELKLIERQSKRLNKYYKLEGERLTRIIEQLEQRTGHGSKFVRAVLANITRPLFGGATGGAMNVGAGVMGFDVEDDFWTWVGVGTALGTGQRLVQNSKKIPLGSKEKYLKLFHSHALQFTFQKLREWTAGTTVTKLASFGGTTEKIGRLLLPQIDDPIASKSVLAQANSMENYFMRKASNLIKNSTPEERGLAISINRGNSDLEKTASSKVLKLADDLNSWMSELKVLYNKAGFYSPKELDNYFPRVLNWEAINADRTKAIDIFTDVFQANYKIKSREEAKKRATKYIERNEGVGNISVFNANELGKLISGISRGVPRGTKETNLIYTPISDHITKHRSLQGPYKIVEEVLERNNFLVNDLEVILPKIIQDSVKSIAFARTFGKGGQLLRPMLHEIQQKYNNLALKGGKLGASNKEKALKHEVSKVLDTVDAYFGRHGLNNADAFKNSLGIISMLNNLNMLGRVTITSLGDIVQPFQNSLSWTAAFKGLARTNLFKASWEKGLARNLNYDIAHYVDRGLQRSAASADKDIILNTSWMGKWGVKDLKNHLKNPSFYNSMAFKGLGLEWLTGYARRFAYNAGSADVFNLSRQLYKLKNINSKTGYRLQKELYNTYGITKNQALSIGKHNNFKSAATDKNAFANLNRAGMEASNRDAIIPQVHNRLLFTQSKTPYIRILGQFLSWAQGKSAQTNKILQRIEDGNARTLIKTLAVLPVYAGIQQLREYAKHGDVITDAEYNGGELAAKAWQLSGMPGWLSDAFYNRFVGPGSKQSPFYAIAPAFSMANAFQDIFIASIQGRGDDALRTLDKRIAPFPEWRAWVRRFWFPKAGSVGVSGSAPKLSFAYGGFVPRQKYNHGDVVVKNKPTLLINELKKDAIEVRIKPKHFEPVIKLKPSIDWENKLPSHKEASQVVIGSNETNINRIEDNVNKVYYALKKHSLSDDAIAGVMGNIATETGNTFNFTQQEIDYYDKNNNPVYKKNSGYGLFQFTDEEKNKGHRTEYNNYLANNNLNDSVESQVNYVMDNIYKGTGYDIGSGNRDTIKNIFKTGKAYESAGIFHDFFENPESDSSRLDRQIYADTIVKKFAEGGEVIRQGYSAGALTTKVVMPIINRALTQITKTKGSYKKFNNILKDYNKTEKVLDFGSGLGHGTPLLKGTKVISHEPYAQPLKITNTKGRLPDYKDVDTLIQREGLNSQDAVIHHMVTNVIDNPLERQLTIKTIGDLLKKDGISILTSRSKTDVSKAKTKEVFGDGFIIGKGSERTFQKGFGQDELQKYVKNILGDAFEVFKIPNKYKISGSGVIIKKLDDAVKLSEGGQVRQLLNGGGSTYRRNARESYIASSNKPKASSSNTGSSIGPAGMGGGSFKPDDKPEDYGTATHDAGGSSDDGGNGGVSKIIKTLKPDIVDVTIPIPREDRDVRKEKMKRVFEDREMKAGAWKEFNLFGGEGKVGGELFLESAGQGLEIDTGMRADTTWQKGDTFIQGQYDSGDWSVAGKKGILEASIKGNEDDTSGYIGVNIPLSFKSGGLLDRKRS